MTEKTRAKVEQELKEQGFVIVDDKDYQLFLEAKNRKAKKQEKQEKKIARELEYDNSHFSVKETVTDENGKTSVVRYPVSSGYYTESGVTFNWDGNGYIVLVNSLFEYGNGHKPFIKQYTRCKESSKNYYFKSRCLAGSKESNEQLAVAITTGMTIEEVIAKAHVAKGFKATENARVLECIETAKGSATTVYAKFAKLQEKHANKSEATEVVA